ncbi:MAG: iron-containing alcohol dehydrogenase [Planctomycetaceae bacterium]|jgi:alcohol dehydrogenase class IV
MVLSGEVEVNFELTFPRQVVFGSGRVAELGGLIAAFAQRAFVLTGSRALERTGQLGRILERLTEAGVVAVVIDCQTREPQVEDVNRCAERIAGHGPGAGDCLLAVGGGSAIDLAKGVAARLAHPEAGDIVEFLEGVGTGRRLTRETLPLVAVPTTAGTGAEATRNAVLSSLSPPFKKSLRSEKLLPRLVVVDPELTLWLPATVTATTGLDAITQLVESYVSCRATPITRSLVATGLPGAVPALSRAYREPGHLPSRETLARAALLSGMALANSGLGLAHGVAAALGIEAGVPHGLACAVLLPVAMRFNRPHRPEDFAQLGEWLSGRGHESPSAAAEAGVQAVESLLSELGIPRRLRELGVARERLPELARQSRGNSLSGNPVPVEPDVLLRVLEEVW